MDRAEKKRKITRYKSGIQITMVIYIIFGLLLGVLNGAMSNVLEAQTQYIIHLLYQLYEHEGRVLTVLLCSIFTVRLLKISKGEISRFRKITLVSLNMFMIVLHLIIPYILGFRGIYIIFMPFPWSTSILQVWETGGIFSTSYEERFGAYAFLVASSFYLVYQLIVLVGTLLLGRRWHCTLICTMNACHAETAGEALPMRTLNEKRPKSKAISQKGRKGFLIFQGAMFLFNIGLIVLWVLYITLSLEIIPIETLQTMELLKYLLLELIFMCIFWLIIGGRGYCYYCPAGTMLGFISKASGQQITTGLTQCTQCGLCNDACKMSLDIMSYAEKGVPMRNMNCVGCNLCVEACPHGNLEYTTKFLTKLRLYKQNHRAQ